MSLSTFGSLATRHFNCTCTLSSSNSVASAFKLLTASFRIRWRAFALRTTRRRRLALLRAIAFAVALWAAFPFPFAALFALLFALGGISGDGARRAAYKRLFARQPMQTTLEPNIYGREYFFCLP